MLADYNFPNEQRLAVGFSGGGDSTALLSLTLKHAPQGIQIHALIVDHALRNGSGREALLAKKRAEAMGAKAKILTWRGAKPKTALQEKARIARYHLLGTTCRELDVTTLLLGHNEDDQAETILMRTQNGSGWRGLAGMAEHRQAPVWPALRGINIVRPLLGQTRAALRAYNAQNNLDYVDDPSNENRSFMRIQMRDMLGNDPFLRAGALAMGASCQKRLSHEKMEIAAYIKLNARIKDWGGVYLARSALFSHCQITAQALRMIILAVSGQAYFAETSKLKNLVERMRGATFAGATLGGAQIIKQKDWFLIARDKGMVLGRGEINPMQAMALKAGQTQVWDGRLLIKANGKDIEVLPYEIAQKKCKHSLMPKSAEVPMQAQPTLPVSIQNSGALFYHSLVSVRLKALLG